MARADLRRLFLAATFIGAYCFFGGALRLFADEPAGVPDAKVLKRLGLEDIQPQKDATTGFVVGGVNTTASIRALTELNGQPIADLEARMRPGASSEGGSDAGFLGAEESLLEVLAADNDLVTGELQLSHPVIARHLKRLAAAALEHGDLELDYEGRRFRVETMIWRGYQDSPFKDGTKSNVDVTVTNVATGKKVEYSLLVPLMVERYGFYEGKGTSYRVDPRTVVEVLDFLKKPAGEER